MPLSILLCQKGWNRLQPDSPMQRLLIPAWTACKPLSRHLEMIPAMWTRSAGSSKLWLDNWCQREFGHSVDAWIIITKNCLEPYESQMWSVHSCQTDGCLCISNGFKCTEICKFQAVPNNWLKGIVCMIAWQRKIKKRIIMLHKTCEENIWHDSTGVKYNVVYYGMFKNISSLLVLESLFYPRTMYSDKVKIVNKKHA